MTAKTKFARISAQKARLVAAAIRGMQAGEALNKLRFTPQKAGGLFYKLINSAIANAVDKSPSVNVDHLVIDRVFVDEGPRSKRWSPRAMGRAYSIHKHSSHLTVVLTQRY
jgi:large subunit ribosomal protein L22